MSNKFYGWGKEDDEFYVRFALLLLCGCRGRGPTPALISEKKMLPKNLDPHEK